MKTTDHPDYQWIPIAGDLTQMERTVRSWFDSGQPLFWRPIFDPENFPAALPEMFLTPDPFGGACWLISRPESLLSLPSGIKGWLMPCDAEDTDIACGRWENSITFMAINDRWTGVRVTYQTDQD
ncbi:hypothetical protein [Aromatoleum bremense]|uniref:Uncharacterized protein n=1 Tax=Aromatoleum bremense TaxID=76115 RepID=A0ABX1P119_9RHOO|nr:hypothetical protein [Aromatoleum bremense]NMG17405.1 hypothetical protein [Aromatoleum bremense]QTQ33196.1 Uncharacterized protein pbN1_32080 [Aromatoleum bremense]